MCVCVCWSGVYRCARECVCQGGVWMWVLGWCVSVCVGRVYVRVDVCIGVVCISVCRSDVYVSGGVYECVCGCVCCGDVYACMDVCRWCECVWMCVPRLYLWVCGYVCMCRGRVMRT